MERQCAREHMFTVLIGLRSGGQGTIVDSGTTFTYFPTAVFNDLKAKINTWCHAGANRCVGSGAGLPVS